MKVLDSQVKVNQEKVCPSNLDIQIKDNYQEIVLPDQKIFAAGCLHKFLSQWESITEDPVTLDAVTGFTIPFSELPPCRVPTQQELTSLDNDPVVDQSIEEILKLKAAVIVPSNSPGFYSRVFTVPKLQRGVEYGKRFIINLKVSFISFIFCLRHDRPDIKFIGALEIRLSILQNLRVLWGKTIGPTLYIVDL